MNRTMTILILILILMPLTTTAADDGVTPRVEPQVLANGIGINLPIIGRLIGGGNTLFSTSVNVGNNTDMATQVDFYFDGVDLTTQDPIVITGSISNDGIVPAESGSVRGYSNVHLADFVDALVQAGMMTQETRDNGVLGSLFLVFDDFTRRGEASASARFENEFGGGTVGVALTGKEITANEPQELVATVRDTRSGSGPQLYTNMFINNIGLTPSGAPAGPVTVELIARSSRTGLTTGMPLTITDLGPGQTQVIPQTLTALQVSPEVDDTILVFATVTSGNAAIAGATSTVDATTRDGAVVTMSRADF